jgi:hypothetical protein
VGEISSEENQENFLEYGKTTDCIQAKEELPTRLQYLQIGKLAKRKDTNCTPREEHVPNWK